MVAIIAFFVASSGAVTGSPSRFESQDAPVPSSNPPLPDANMTVDTTGNSDWNCFANGKATGFVASGITVGTGTPAATCATNLVYANAFAKTDPAATTADDSWQNGTKMDVACAPVAQNKNPGKDDFTAIASYTEMASNKDQYLYGATIRVAPNGNASENVELNQVAGTAACPITRTAGDHLLAFDYLNGGATLSLHVLTWIDSTHQTLGGNNGLCVVKTDSMPCWGANALLPGAAAFDGGVSQSAIAATANGINGQALVANEFAEFGVNLTTALGQTAGACNSTAQIDWESRSSGSSFSSNPEDLSIENKSFSNCGGIIIRKVTSPTPDPNTTTFNYGDTIVSATDTFTLKDQGSKDFGSTVQAGSYNVTETPHAGYTLSKIDCSASSLTKGSTVSYGTSDSTFQAGDTKVNITLKAGDSIDCTYTNTLNTAPLTTQQSTSADVTPGAAVTDTATVTGSVTSLNPSGTVTFRLCGPFTLQPTGTGCSSSDSTNVAAGTGTLSGPTPATGISTATSSPAVNTGTGSLTPGWYCFEATWPGDTNYIGAKDATSATNECFHVSKIDTSTVTTPSDSSGVSKSSITLTGTIYDKAVVTGTTLGGTPTGNVVFHVCGPISTGNCSTDGTPVGTSTGVALGAPTTATSATAVSAGFTPTATGRYCFRGEYGGNTVYNGSSDPTNTTATNECFTVTDTTSASSTQSWYPNDSGSVATANGANLTGTLTLQLYSNADCGKSESGGGAVTNTAVQASTTLTGTSSTGQVSTSNTSYHVDADGSYSWLTTFTSTDGNVGSSTHCETTTLTINNNPTQ